MYFLLFVLSSFVLSSICDTNIFVVCGNTEFLSGWNKLKVRTFAHSKLKFESEDFKIFLLHIIVFPHF